ncbi:hypothetical protein ACFXJ8_29175 [Nonomuraea sp. NPDC059194]|uniref:hypothetical protein n=1 Tax=Nonomuraea sp. NPDC059194 TaxID=3346764 RepID=UPI00367B9B3A
MKYRVIAFVALVAAVIAFFVINRSTGGTATATAAGHHYTVTVTAGPTVEVTVGTNQATSVVLTAAMPSMGHALPEAALTRVGPGVYRAAEDLFPMAGIWELTLRLTGEAGDETLTVALPIIN